MNADALPPWLHEPFCRATAALAAGRLGHALIIHGPPGWGQTELARALTLALLNHEGVPAEFDLSQLAHPDLRWILPEGKGEQIKIDVVRALGEFTAQTPQQAHRKVVVLDPADALNEHAANALLKTLEEPAGATYLLLVTESLHDLLPTIRSRCQRLDIQPVPWEGVEPWLRGRVPGGDIVALGELALELGQAPYRIVAAAAREETTIGSTLAAILSGRTVPMAVAERMLTLPLDEVVGRSMRYLATALSPRAMPSESGMSIHSALARTSSGRILAFWDEHLEARRSTLGTTNPNPRLLVERLLAGWRQLAPPLQGTSDP